MGVPSYKACVRSLLQMQFTLLNCCHCCGRIHSFKFTIPPWCQNIFCNICVLYLLTSIQLFCVCFFFLLLPSQFIWLCCCSSSLVLHEGKVTCPEQWIWLLSLIWWMLLLAVAYCVVALVVARLRSLSIKVELNWKSILISLNRNRCTAFCHSIFHSVC